MIVRLDQSLESVPPKWHPPINQIGGDKKSEGRGKAAKQWIGVRVNGLVAIIKGQADEWARWGSAKSAESVPKRNDVDVPSAKILNKPF